MQFPKRISRRIYGYIIFVIWAIIFAFFFKSLLDSPLFPKITKRTISKHFDANEIQINQLVSDFRESLKDKNMFVEVEIYEDKTLHSIHIIKGGIEYGAKFPNSDSLVLDSILNILEWSKSDLRNLTNQIYGAGCISVSNSIPAEVSVHRTSIESRFNYLIFYMDLSLPKHADLREQFDNNCNYIYYRDNIVFKFEPSLLSSDCFPERFLKNKN